MGKNFFAKGLTTFAMSTILVLAMSSCSPLKNEESEAGAIKPTNTEISTSAPKQSEGTEQIVFAPVDLTCNEVLSPEEIYQFNPNILLDESLVAANGPGVEIAQRYEGLVCSYVNETSRETITVSLVQLNNAGFEKYKKDIGLSESLKIPSEKGEVFFTSSEGNGTFYIFTPKYFIIVDGPQFISDQDGKVLISDIKSSLS